MKKLCLTFSFSLLLSSFLPAAVDATTSSKTKHLKKKHVIQPAASAESRPAPAAPTVERNHGIPREKLVAAYDYAKNLYAGQQFDKAKDIFKKIVLAATDEDLNSDALYLYSQCSFHTEDFTACVKGLTILAKRWPDCPLIKGGYVSRFCSFLINDVANLQTHWDYYRFKERLDENGNPIWKESIPPGFKIKRINFKLGFGLFRVLRIIEPNSEQTAAAGRKLNYMLNAPITMIWVDEKAPPNPWGHPADFFSIFSTNERKDFSKVICDRMFFDWQTEKLYQFLVMYDDVRNLKPRFVARTKEPEESEQVPVPANNGALTASPVPGGPAAQIDPTAVLTLSKLFQVAGYNPFSDTYTNVIESSPTDLNL